MSTGRCGICWWPGRRRASAGVSRPTRPSNDGSTGVSAAFSSSSASVWPSSMNTSVKGTVPTPLFKKLNLGNHDEIVVFDAPGSFESELKKLKGVTIVRNPSKPKAVRFAVAFAATQVQLDRASKVLAAAAEGDAVLWFVYPKGTSKRYSCEFNHDSGCRL